MPGTPEALRLLGGSWDDFSWGVRAMSESSELTTGLPAETGAATVALLQNLLAEVRNTNRLLGELAACERARELAFTDAYERMRDFPPPPRQMPWEMPG